MAQVWERFGLRALPAFPAKAPFVGEHPVAQRFRAYGEAGRRAIAEQFVGITTDGRVVPDLFSVGATGVTTRPVVDAALAFFEALGVEQRATARFGIEDPMWQAWSNIHAYVMRHGVLLDECTPRQRQAALDLVAATCSARGFGLARDVMRLNDALGEITGRRDEYSEWFYWLSVFGEPSADEPWGWQLDGHHLIINCFVLGDQLVLTPSFFGAEPTAVETGTHAGTRVFGEEEQRGLAFARSLSATQRRKASGDVGQQRMDGRVQTAAFRDNLVLPYAGLAGDELSSSQRAELLALIEVYTARARDGHARVHLEQVARHLDATHFLWVGELEEDSVFYYRVHSPVILIEFDHLNGIAFDNEEPSRNHIHTVVRTPNGNDYGKDLLRQHYAHAHHLGAGEAGTPRTRRAAR